MLALLLKLLNRDGFIIDGSNVRRTVFSQQECRKARFAADVEDVLHVLHRHQGNGF
ncbi:Uncharacterised protein [Vibrio cholerae]|nr:Uncharacterised protein [Vibrio cholerae]